MTTSDIAGQAEWVTCEHHWVWHLGTDIAKGVEVATCSLCGHIKAGLATDRPTPPLPTEPGSVVDARCARSSEVLRWFRRDDGWSGWDGENQTWRTGYPDVDLIDPVVVLDAADRPIGSPEPAERSPESPQSVVQPLCECGHGRGRHTTPSAWCTREPCRCTAYRPATPSTEETR